MKVFKKTAPKLAVLGEFAKLVQTGTQSEIAAALAALTTNPLFATKGWQYNFAKLARVIKGDGPQYSVLMVTPKALMNCWHIRVNGRQTICSILALATIVRIGLCHWSVICR